MFVSAEFGRVQKKLYKDVGGHNQNETDPQQRRDHAVEEEPAEYTEYSSVHGSVHAVLLLCPVNTVRYSLNYLKSVLM